ncbi:hypothetical protein CDAR_31292 [Caerostris darwini]|uniref:Uncharacterized protein n=1 Tax=Caerostris darwini TaxID=1538125 RepID=A0AAV4Q430_9ARAC|nr:hypothetical protein CDAR_31292 [Caerostris darwini]
MASGRQAADVSSLLLVRSAGASVSCTPGSAPHSETTSRRFWMAKVLLSDQIGSPTPVWTVNPHLSRQDNGNSGVDNPAFYDSESGLCSREDAYPKKPVAWTGDETHCSKRQCGGRLVLLMVAVCLLLAVLMAMVTAVIYLAVGEVRTTWQDEAEFQDMEEGISLITHSMDAVFLHSLPFYNETRVLSYREGSVIARCHVHFSKPRMDATHQVGMAVVQALERHHGYLPGGLLQVDIRSLHFTGLPGSIEIVADSQEEVKEDSSTQAPSGITSTTEVVSSDCGGVCEEGQVCIFLPQTPFSRCLVPRDAHDPSGCGGWCMSEHQLCKRLGNSTFQCTDNLACKAGEWQCENGLCIESKKRCNGRVDCYDMSDEQDCECGDGMFRCGNSTPCLPERMRCDGHIDCWDASDEVNCTKSCGDHKFTCNDGRCIQMSLFCDRFPDCPDGTDEPEGCSESCLQTQKQCRNGRCVALSLWCNGSDDCKDGSDELGCSKT